MDLGGSTACLKKLNGNNYIYWKACIESYLQGHDLWEVVGGDETNPPEVAAEKATMPENTDDPQKTQEKKTPDEALRKWRIKSGKAMYVLRISVEEELLEYIREAATPKAAWDILATLFSKKNDARLQLLEKELMTTSQGNMTISQYFTKVKSICSEIAQISPEEKISEPRMRRIIVNGLKPEYSGFMAAVQGWSTPPTLLELENMLANQEALTRRAEASTRQDEEALFCNRRKGRSEQRPSSKPENKPNQQMRPKENTNASGGVRSQRDGKPRSGECYNCGKRGHYTRDCWSKKKGQGNAATLRDRQGAKSQKSYDSEEE